MIGVLEYRDSVFVKDLLKRIGRQCQWISYHQLPAPFFNDYKIILDRLSLQNEFLNTALKIQSMNGVYVINNPFSCDVLNKGVNMSVLSGLGIPHPKTFVLPSFDDAWDLDEAIGSCDWDIIKYEFRTPLIMKPALGWGWRDVYEINSFEELEKKYAEFKNKQLMVVQERINADKFFRVFCIGKEKAKAMLYNPAPLGAGRIVEESINESLKRRVEDWSLKFCRKVDLDLNVVEWAVRGEDAFVIDAYNPIPDVSDDKMPREHYEWIVDNTIDFLNEVYDSNARNRQFF